ncbi:LytR/AlgR family response regulator transcription factor [Actomonas aquatica]|uniref:LytTR family DNA-binding domain-containing protein n=1 Tax=Actomonas aquatica TaxID=2866162 RepID=A0ABZ1C5B4_9BACT|nr:LytTR family DNA-binding domain-containing protein [Opitutus sp. WL0086]WRQ86671.1 LytTR family DNA-binding domain-containing protein [Opitutus sp. WL0086]
MSDSLRTLLIDDEPLARLELRRLLKTHPQIEIVGEAGTLNAARALLADTPFDLVFLDIQLRGGSGFDLLDRIPPHAHIVFVTAYDRYAVRAFEVNALDYLLKPVTSARLASSLQRVLAAPTSAADDTTAAAAMPLLPDDRVLVKTSDATRFVPVQSIVSVTSNENYTELQLADAQKLMTLRTLKSWEACLPTAFFVRIHRQTLINLAHVRAIVRGEGESVQFQFDDPLPPLSASRRRVSDLKQRLEAAGLTQLLP